MRDSVRLNSLESFLVNLPSISSETWEMYSWAIPGSSVFCDWLFLVFFVVSLETAANFLLFLNVAMILRQKFRQLWGLNFFNLYEKCQSPLLWGKADFNKGKQSMISKNEHNTKRLPIYIWGLLLSILLFIPFTWRKHNCLHANLKYKQGKCFNHIIYKRKMPTLARNKHHSVHFFFDKLRLCHL